MACKNGYRPYPEDDNTVECYYTNQLCVACRPIKNTRRKELDLDVMKRCPKYDGGDEE